MAQYNLTPTANLEDTYDEGLLPQRNNKKFFYKDSSSRSNLTNFTLNSENRRIIHKTDNYTFTFLPITEFNYTSQVQKSIHGWINGLGWDFPVKSLKTVFNNHIFNYVYTWYNDENIPVAYSICYFDKNISHIAYVFYNPDVSHGNLPIRLVLQFVIDSHQKNLKFAYLGRFSESIGYYKRNMPGFEYYSEGHWLTYQH
jgi:hypothetical protein